MDFGFAKGIHILPTSSLPSLKETKGKKVSDFQRKEAGKEVNVIQKLQSLTKGLHLSKHSQI